MATKCSSTDNYEFMSALKKICDCKILMSWGFFQWRHRVHENYKRPHTKPVHGSDQVQNSETGWWIFQHIQQCALQLYRTRHLSAHLCCQSGGHQRLRGLYNVFKTVGKGFFKNSNMPQSILYELDWISDLFI